MQKEQNNTMYIDDLFREDYYDFLQKDYKCSHELTVEFVENGIVLPFQSSTSEPSKGVGGVLDKNHVYVGLSKTVQENLMEAPESLNDEQLLNIEYRKEEVIYLGYFIKQWGHFLVDFIPRLWWLVNNYDNQKIIYLARDSKSIIDGNYLRLLELFGIHKDRIECIHSITSFKKIIIPEMSINRPDSYSSEYLKIIDRIVEKTPDITLNYEKVYFTRTKLKKACNSELGEIDVESFFKKNGFKVLAPEKCSLELQINIFRKCKEIASLSGTIPHNIVFGTSDTKLIIINKTVRINTTQIILNKLIGCDTTYIDAFVNLLPVSPASGPFWVRVNDNMKEFALDNNYIIKKENKIIESIKVRSALQKYFLIYCRNINSQYDIGGKIVASSRPLYEGKHVEDIYYYYRATLPYFNSHISFRATIKELIKQIKKWFKRKKSS